MNYKTTLALLIMLALVGVYFYFFERDQISGFEARQQQQTEISTKDPGSPVFTEDTLAAGAIDCIDITRSGKSVTLVKEAGEWLQTQPVRFPLENYAAEAITERFSLLRYLQSYKPSDPQSPTAEQMGLDEPRAVVVVHVGDQSWTLKLGKISMGRRGYVKVDGDDTTYVVDSALHGAVLDETVTQWRRKSIAAPLASGSSRIELAPTEAETISLHTADGSWRFDTQFIERPSKDAIDDLFASVRRLRIDQFIEDNPSSLNLYGLNKPYLRITISEPGEDDAHVKHTLNVGRIDLSGASRYATWTQGDEPPTVVFTVNSASAEGLVRTKDQLRDPRVIVAQRQDVRGLSVEHNGVTTLHILRDPQAGYSFAASENTPESDTDPGYGVDFSTANALIESLCSLESTRFTTDISALSQPIANVRLKQAISEGETEFSVYGSGEDRTIVTQGESVGYIVPASELDTLLGPKIGLRNRTLLELPEDKIASIQLKRQGASYEFQRTAGAPGEHPGWELVGSPSIESETFNALLRSLYPLRVERWLDRITSSDVNPIELTIVPVAGEPYKLYADPSGSLAWLDGIDSLFLLSDSFTRLLNAEYLNRTVLDLTSDQITSFTIADHATRVTIKRDGQRFVSDDGEPGEPGNPGEPGEPTDQVLAAGVFDTLAGLRVEHYVSPLHLRPEDIDFSIELTSTDDVPRVLRFVGMDGHQTTATLDDKSVTGPMRWFTLTPETIARLRAPLSDVETPIK